MARPCESRSDQIEWLAPAPRTEDFVLLLLTALLLDLLGFVRSGRCSRNRLVADKNSRRREQIADGNRAANVPTGQVTKYSQEVGRSIKVWCPATLASSGVAAKGRCIGGTVKSGKSSPNWLVPFIKSRNSYLGTCDTGTLLLYIATIPACHQGRT